MVFAWLCKVMGGEIEQKMTMAKSLLHLEFHTSTAPEVIAGPATAISYIGVIGVHWL